jgi:hypothetical protein
MMVVMGIDEARAIDHKSCVRVLIARCDTGFTMLTPAYHWQNPDRRGRAGVQKLRAAATETTETIEDGKAY